MITAEEARNLMPDSAITNTEKEIEKEIIKETKNNNYYVDYTITGTVNYCLRIIEDLKKMNYLVHIMEEKYNDWADTRICYLTITW